MNGDTLHLSTLLVEGDVDCLTVQAIELRDGVAGGSEEAERVHEHPIDNAG